MNSRMKFLITLFFFWGNAMAQSQPEAPSNPHSEEIVRLQHEVALLTQQNALLAAQNTLATTQNAAISAQTAALTARFGTAPALPTGDIQGAEQLGGLTNRLLADVMKEAAQQIAKAAPENQKEKRLVITANPDRRTQIIQGYLIFIQMKALQEEIKRMISSHQSANAQSLTYDGTMAALGAVEKLIGVFRADYTVNKIAIQIDNTAMQIAVAHELLKNKQFASVQIDGLAVSDTLPLLSLLADIRIDVDRLDEIAKNEIDPAIKKKISEISDRARKLFETGDTSGKDDRTIFERAALAQQWSPSDIVLFVKPVMTDGVLVRAKSWFSLRNTVHAILSGVIEYAYVNPDNEIEKAGIINVGRKMALNLKQLAKADTSWQETGN